MEPPRIELLQQSITNLSRDWLLLPHIAALQLQRATLRALGGRQQEEQNGHTLNVRAMTMPIGIRMPKPVAASHPCTTCHIHVLCMLSFATHADTVLSALLMTDQALLYTNLEVVVRAAGRCCRLHGGAACEVDGAGRHAARYRMLLYVARSIQWPRCKAAWQEVSS